MLSINQPVQSPVYSALKIFEAIWQSYSFTGIGAKPFDYPVTHTWSL